MLIPETSLRLQRVERPEGRSPWIAIHRPDDPEGLVVEMAALPSLVGGDPGCMVMQWAGRSGGIVYRVAMSPATRRLVVLLASPCRVEARVGPDALPLRPATAAERTAMPLVLPATDLGGDAPGTMPTLVRVRRGFMQPTMAGSDVPGVGEYLVVSDLEWDRLRASLATLSAGD